VRERIKSGGRSRKAKARFSSRMEISIMGTGNRIRWMASALIIILRIIIFIPEALRKGRRLEEGSTSTLIHKTFTWERFLMGNSTEKACFIRENRIAGN